MKQITFDTNIFLHNFNIIKNNYNNYEKVFLLPVISEIDNIKVNGNALTKHKARTATREILKMLKDKSVSAFMENPLELHTDIISLSKFDIIDDLIISICHKNDIKLVTMDCNVYLKGINLGVDVELVESDTKIENLSMVYKGVKEVFTSKEIVDLMFRNKKIDVEILSQDLVFNENECVTLINSENPNCKIMSIHQNGMLNNIPFSNASYWGLLPLSIEQRYALFLLDNNDIKIVSLTGESGSSKTILSLAVGLEKKVNFFGKGNLYIARPPVSLSRKLQLGFKKGTTIDKAMGSLGSYSTNLEKLSSSDKNRTDGMKILESLLEQGKVKYLNLEDILGMSFSENDYIIIDEAELLTKSEMKAILTRGGKMVVIGDCDQNSENSGVDYENSGLLHLIEVGKKSTMIAHLTLEQVYRGKIVEEINKIW